MCIDERQKSPIEKRKRNFKFFSPVSREERKNGKILAIIANFSQSLTRGQKVQSRREREIKNSFLQFREKKEKPEIPFASFEREKRILKEYAQLSRGEREMDFLCSSFKKRKRK